MINQYISTKPTLYLIDGLNLVRSFLMQFGQSEDEITSQFLDFLTQASQDPKYSMNDYHVIFDGGFRPVGPLYRAGVQISFSEECSADQIIYEQAEYQQQAGRRVMVVTSDRSLQDSVKALGVKTIFCKKFYYSFHFSEK